MALFMVSKGSREEVVEKRWSRRRCRSKVVDDDLRAKSQANAIGLCYTDFVLSSFAPVALGR